jgi:branched-chain amino acid transport system ATP-binding protein
MRVAELRSGYGRGQVLQGVNLEIPAGQIVALLGRNGVGKSTLVHTMMGLVQPSSGSVVFEGSELAGLRPHAIAKRGIGLVPQGRRIFPRLTVEDNLRIAQRRGANGAAMSDIYELLPRLAERRSHRGDQLSGGEQQMVAIGRVLLASPRLLLLDEPFEGLAPLVGQEIRDVIARLISRGVSALLVEQNLWLALEMASAISVMVRGEVAYQATAEDVRRDPAIACSLLGVS